MYTDMYIVTSDKGSESVIFHKYKIKQKVAKNKASKHILNSVQKSKKPQRCLRSNSSILKPSFSTNFLHISPSKFTPSL